MRYAKFLLALSGAGVTALTAVISDGTVTKSEWLFVLLSLASAVGVYLIPNAEPAPVDSMPVETPTLFR